MTAQHSTRIILFLCIFCLVPFAVSADPVESCSGAYQNQIAIFIEPTAAEVEQMQKAYGEEFNDIYDDRNYYQWQAVSFFKKKDFPHCVTDADKHSFVMPDGSTKAVDANCNDWCLILWNGTKEPILTGAIDLFVHYEYLGFPPVVSE